MSTYLPSRSPTPVTIVGGGWAAVIKALSLLKETPRPDITIYSDHFDGGDLVKYYGWVMSNTTWEETRAPFLSMLPSPWADRIRSTSSITDASDCFELRHLQSIFHIIVDQLRHENVRLITEYVTSEALSEIQGEVILATGCKPAPLPKEQTNLDPPPSNIVTLRDLATSPLDDYCVIVGCSHSAASALIYLTTINPRKHIDIIQKRDWITIDMDDEGVKGCSKRFLEETGIIGLRQEEEITVGSTTIRRVKNVSINEGVQRYTLVNTTGLVVEKDAPEGTITIGCRKTQTGISIRSLVQQ